MRTREQIIVSMCYTYRHDFGLERDKNSNFISCGMTDNERMAIRSIMTQIFDNDIAPYMQFKEDDIFDPK